MITSKQLTRKFGSKTAVNAVDLHDMFDFGAKRVARNHNFALGLRICKGSTSLN